MAPPVLLVHGFATTAKRTWRDNGWIDILSESGRTVIAPDLLGHGSAPTPHDPADYEQMHRLLLDVLPDEPVDAIGFSLGSRLLLTLASEEPERFHRIVATGVGESLLRKDESAAVEDALLGVDQDTGDNPLISYFRQLGAAPGVDPQALVALMRRSTNVPLTDEQLARVSCPVLVALGDRDFAGPGEPLVDRLPDASLAVLRGVDHFSTPKSFELIDVALAFLDRERHVTDEFILGVDLDGVCGDHAEAFRLVVAADRGIDPSELAPQQTWDFTEWGIDSDEFERLHRLAILEHRFFRTMPVVEGCAEALWRLSDAGVWIRLITHRLYSNWGHAVAVADTVEWLDANGIPYRDLCFLGQKPQVEAHAYVDDAVHNIVSLRAEADRLVIVFDQPYNRDLPGPRASSWDDVEALVRADMTQRGHAVQGQLDIPADAPGRLRDRLGGES